SGVLTALGLDADMNSSTGPPHWDGTDYLFIVDQSDHSYGFEHWNGSDWEQASYATVGVRTTSTGITISVNRSELGNTSEFNFWVRTVNGDPSSDRSDEAPDLGVWNYALATNGPDILDVLVQPTPALPKAGKSFALAPAGLKLPLVI